MICNYRKRKNNPNSILKNRLTLLQSTDNSFKIKKLVSGVGFFNWFRPKEENNNHDRDKYIKN